MSSIEKALGKAKKDTGTRRTECIQCGRGFTKDKSEFSTQCYSCYKKEGNHI